MSPKKGHDELLLLLLLLVHNVVYSFVVSVGDR